MAMEAAEEAKSAEAAKSRKAEPQAVQDTATQKAAGAQDVSPVSSEEANDNKGTMKKAAIGALVLLLLIGAYFMFGKKKETPPAPEPPKVETTTETKTGAKTETNKAADQAAREAKLKEYAETVKAANAKKKQEAAAGEKLVFLVENVQRKGKDLAISGHFYNGKKNRTIISVKAMELDIALRDMDKEVLNEKNIKCTKSFTGMELKPLQDSPMLTVELPGKAPEAEFNNFTVTAHDVHWEGIGK